MMVDFARLAGLQHETDASALFVANKMVMDRTAGQQSAHRNAVFVAGPIGEDDQAVPRLDCR